MGAFGAQGDGSPADRRHPRWLLLAAYAAGIASFIADIVQAPSLGRTAIDLLCIASIAFAGWLTWDPFRNESDVASPSIRCP